MGTEPGSVKSKKEKRTEKTKKEKQPKLNSVSKYEITRKADGEQFAPFFGKGNSAMRRSSSKH